ncbi:MAG: 4-(cytidine 5'-diphospho)-2-C-methyl-D-erythritol kinase, partial [bacterium]|nr:4-(cytidine 5'-diphospho)-2-C-methyl-D-erythritol kinase [bacterium]
MFAPRDSDGYHPLQSVFQTIAFGDTLSVEVQDTPGFKLTHSGLHIPGDGSNIISRIYTHYAAQLKFGYHVNLHKQIPVGAGLGGGSSNAATFLKTLNAHEGWGWTSDNLEAEGVKFGADVPFFVNGGTQLVEGIGERLTPLEPRPKRYFVLINPNIHSDTSAVYAAYDAAAQFPALSDVPDWMRHSHVGENSLWPVVKARIPELADLDQWLKSNNGPELHLSGSGATVFLTMSDESRARTWEATIRKT